MRTERFIPSRAVTPWFRAFGERRRVPANDRIRLHDFPGSDAGECLALGLIFPSLAAVACFDALWRVGGGWLAWLGVVPVSFLLLHGLAFGLQVGRPSVAAGVWSLLASAWAWWMLEKGGATPVRGVAWAWMAALALQVPALVVLAWRWGMRAGGMAGRVAVALMLPVVALGMGWMLGRAWGFAFFHAGVALWALGTFLPRARIFGRVATRVSEGGPLLSFDDGPHPEDTPAILDLLDRHGRKAVFFVIGDQVREFPELAREIVARGHELGNHSMTHPQACMWRLGPRRTRREIEDCQRTIEKIAGVTPHWYRAPVGHRNFFTHPVTQALGLEVVAWTRRAFDTQERDVAKMTKALTEGVDERDILLLHEGTPVAVELAEAVLRELDQG